MPQAQKDCGTTSPPFLLSCPVFPSLSPPFFLGLSGQNVWPLAVLWAARRYHQFPPDPDKGRQCWVTSTRTYSTLLHSTAVYCNILHCTTLGCTETKVQYTVTYCTALHFTAQSHSHIMTLWSQPIERYGGSAAQCSAVQ